MIIKQNVSVINFGNTDLNIQMIETGKRQAVRKDEVKDWVPTASFFKVWSQGL